MPSSLVTSSMESTFSKHLYPWPSVALEAVFPLPFYPLMVIGSWSANRPYSFRPSLHKPFNFSVFWMSANMIKLMKHVSFHLWFYWNNFNFLSNNNLFSFFLLFSTEISSLQLWICWYACKGHSIALLRALVLEGWWFWLVFVSRFYWL